MSLAHRVSRWNRDRKWRLFQQHFDLTPDSKVLDVGFSENEYSASDNYIERHYPYPGQLTALGVDQPDTICERYPQVQFVHYDGGRFPFEDKAFDICWSNAVIEHVGDRAAQRDFLAEIARVSRRAFITTPNRYFPIEVHTRTPLLHFLPKPVFDRWLRLIGKAWAAGDYMDLLSHRELQRLLREAGIADYRIHRNRLFPFTLDFVVMMDCETAT